MLASVTPMQHACPARSVITPDGVIAAYPQATPNHPAPGEAPGPLTADDRTMDGLTSTPAQRWLARLSFVLAGLVVVILLVFAGLKSLAMVVVNLAAAYFLPRRAPRLGTSGPPGRPVPKPPRDWARLRHLAGISEPAPRSPH
jgi:hypothetical protein